MEIRNRTGEELVRDFEITLRDFPIRTLNGAIDEFLIYNEAIVATEIHAMFEEGKPYGRNSRDHHESYATNPLLRRCRLASPGAL
jgi:hypothetical protein